MALIRLLFILAAVAFVICGRPALQGQELLVQPTPFSVWLDFRKSAQASKSGLPIWMESLQQTFIPAAESEPAKTIFRLRLRRIAALDGEIQFRLFFHDTPNLSPVISGWTETGSQIYDSHLLGSGLDLPTSETVIIPLKGLDYLEVAVPGDGSNLRSAFAAMVKKYEGQRALDFEKHGSVDDPFSNLPHTASSPDDNYLYGRVKATIKAGVIKLSPEGATKSLLEFDLESAPLLAVITFEILNVDPFHPPELTLNEHALASVSIHLPDLADPGYHGTSRALERDMRFRYAGWVQCKQLVPGSLLLSGANKITIILDKNSPPIAIRAVEIELKNNWKNFDYELIP